MKYNLSKPCKECPFKKDSMNGWLGGETASDTFNHIINEGEFACHMTRGKTENEISRCYGSILFLKKACKLPKYDNKLKQAILVVKKEELTNILSIPQFFEHHEIT